MSLIINLMSNINKQKWPPLSYLFLLGLHNLHNNPSSCYKKSILLSFFSKLYFYFSNSFKIIFLRLLDNSHITKQPSKINSSSKNCSYLENNMTANKNFLFFFFLQLSKQPNRSLESKPVRSKQISFQLHPHNKQKTVHSTQTDLNRSKPHNKNPIYMS